MDSILIYIAFAFLATTYHVETKPRRPRPTYNSDEDLTANREVQFNCDLFKNCVPGGPKVCGFDDLTPWLAEFEDMCTLYKVNCESGRNLFSPVDQIVCNTRIKYDKEHKNETFVVIHVRSTPADRPVLKSGKNRDQARVKLVEGQ